MEKSNLPFPVGLYLSGEVKNFAKNIEKQKKGTKFTT